MIITNDFVFIHFPKNAGSFVTDCLTRIYDKRVEKSGQKKVTDNFYYLFDREKTNYSKLYKSENLEYTGEKRVSKHQGCDEIPEKHKNKPIISTIRNPFDRYVSLYHYGWWQKHPIIDEETLYSDFPNFPDLTFKEFLDLSFNYNIELIKKKNNIELDIGAYSLYYIKLFCKNYMDVLSSIDDLDELTEKDFYSVKFFEKENLNKKLFNYLHGLGWPKKEINFILSQTKVNKSRESHSYKSYYDKEDIELIKEKDRLIFKLFPKYEF